MGGGVVRLLAIAWRSNSPASMNGSRSIRLHQRQRAQHQIVGAGVGERARGDALRLDQQDFRVDLRHHLGGDLVLQRQQVVRLAIEAPCPDDLVAGAQIEQPQRDAQPVAHLLDRAVEQEVDAEGAADGDLVALLVGEARQRGGGRHEHPAEPRQRRGDLLGEARAEMGFVLGDADKLQRQHADMGAAAGAVPAAPRPRRSAPRQSPRATALRGAGGRRADARAGRGRGSRPAASASLPRAPRRADPPAPRGSGHRPGSPCRARRARRAPHQRPPGAFMRAVDRAATAAPRE